MSFSGDGLAVVEDVFGLTRFEACLPPHVASPKPGPCPGKGKAGKAVKKAAKKAIAEKPATGKTPVGQKIARPKAVPNTPPGTPAAPPPKAPKASAGKAAARRISTGEANAMQEKMLAGKPWNKAEKDALKEYSAYFYTEMNGLLRGQPQVYDEDLPTEQDIKKAIRTASEGLRPLPEPVTVFRNVDARALLGRRVPDEAERLAGLKELTGTTRQERGFTSTSIHDDLEDFGSEIQLEMDIPAGTPAAFLRQLSESPNEDELLLAPGMRYEFVGEPTKNDKGLLVMKVKVTPP